MIIDRILELLSRSFPFSFSDIKKVYYNRLNSIDDLIKVLQMSSIDRLVKIGWTLFDIVDLWIEIKEEIDTFRKQILSQILAEQGENKR